MCKKAAARDEQVLAITEACVRLGVTEATPESTERMLHALESVGDQAVPGACTCEGRGTEEHPIGCPARLTRAHRGPGRNDRQPSPRDVIVLSRTDTIVLTVIRHWEEGTFTTWEEAMTALVCYLAESRAKLLAQVTEMNLKQQPRDVIVTAEEAVASAKKTFGLKKE